MGHNLSQDDCQRVVRGLMEKYEWALLREEELVVLVLEAIQTEDSPIDLEALTKKQYTIVLYEACRQGEDWAQRERGYNELFRFLYRAAYNRWPDLAEDVTQRALELVYQQLDRCRNPATFLAFALNKLRQAFTEKQRDINKKATDVPIDDRNVEGGQGDLEDDLIQRDCLQKLIEAIARLPNKQQQKAIYGKFFEELSDKEIAARLRVTEANVRKLRHDGLTRLRQEAQLRDCLGESEKSHPHLL